jgi:GNAT superfamily N-acetyltransferase
MARLDPAELLTAYDSQLRVRVPDRLPPGVQVERDGPIVRFTGTASGGWVLYRDLGGLEGDDLDRLIARQVEVFSARGERFEWKLHGHDRPDDLPERLRAAGLVAEEQETIVIAQVAETGRAPAVPRGVALREVTERRDFERIVALENEVWQEDHASLADMLEEEHTTDPDAISVVVAEAGGRVVCAAWIRFEGDTDFATLWGGATLAEWGGRGIYKATVAYRAGLAAERGYGLLEVDASDDSRPILERLGFVPVTTTTPFVWSSP